MAPPLMGHEMGSRTTNGLFVVQKQATIAPGVLLSQTGARWADSGLDPSYGIISLHAENDQLLAGAVRAVMPTRELTFEWIDVSEPSHPRVLCADGQPIADMAMLEDGRFVAVGENGAIYVTESLESP